MPIPTKGPRLGGSPSHERLMLANLATSLFEHGKITTTETKARRVRPLAERLITKAKRGDLHNRRQIQRVIRDKDVVHRLMDEIGPFYTDRPGGYVRITRTLPRKGDNAPMAVIELVKEKTVSSEAEAAKKTKFAKDAPTESAASGPEDATDTGVRESGAETVTVDAATATQPVEVEESESTEDTPYGPGSHAPLDDDSAPQGFAVKADEDSMVYYTEDDASYGSVTAGVWFATAEAAEDAGFERASEDVES